MRRSKPAILQAVIAALLILLFLAAYVAAMRATVPLSKKTGPSHIDDRDLVYLSIHCAVLVLGTLVGFLAGKWLSGLGFAFALLFFAVLAAGMVGIQLGSFAVACHGHNDLIRHWTCG